MLGLADVLGGCSSLATTTVPPQPPSPAPAPALPARRHRGGGVRKAVVRTEPGESASGGFPAPRPGPPTTIFAGPARSAGEIAITVDDGYDAETVAAYVEFAQLTGTPLTVKPNGVYADV